MHRPSGCCPVHLQEMPRCNAQACPRAVRWHWRGGFVKAKRTLACPSMVSHTHRHNEMFTILPFLSLLLPISKCKMTDFYKIQCTHLSYNLFKFLWTVSDISLPAEGRCFAQPWNGENFCGHRHHLQSCIPDVLILTNLFTCLDHPHSNQQQ